MRSLLVAFGVTLVLAQAAACGGGDGGGAGSAGTAAGGRGGGGAGGCTEIAFTQSIYSPGGSLGGIGGGGGGHVTVISQCRSFPAECVNDPHCSCVCPPGLPCYGISCVCTESSGVLVLMCGSD